MATTTRTTIAIDKAEHEAFAELAKQHGWTVAKATSIATRALAQLMAAHVAYAAQHPDDVANLYVRLAREAPASFVEVPKDGVRVGHVGDQPAVQLGNWLVTDLDGDLMAEEMTGDRRLGKVIDGEIKPIRLPSGALN